MSIRIEIMRMMVRLFARLAVLVVGLLAGFGPAVAAGTSASATHLPPLGGLRDWVGIYPNEKIGADNMWSNATFRDALKQTIGPDRFKAFYETLVLGVSQAVEVDGDVLHVWACQSHVCDYFSADIYIDIPHRVMAVCWNDGNAPAGTTDLWLSSSDRSYLPLPPLTCSKNQGFDLYKKYGARP